ncbi:uncharacterized protein Vm26Ac [Drosophila tropicalis]|uniref:uncharacterized protein Vm26Ac n=1 Tax=Drosophila tropicalis TaxID=46794 RepID=UPI0035ABF57A
MWKYLTILSLFCWGSSVAQCGGGCGGGNLMPTYHLIPVRLLLEGSDFELKRQTRQQQILQEVIINENLNGPGGFGGPGFGGPGFGGPGFGGPGLGGPGFGGPGFGGRPGFGRGGFGRPFGFARSYEQEPEEKPSYSAPPAKPTGIPSPPCPQNYVFSCQAVIKPVPCAKGSPCGY